MNRRKVRRDKKKEIQCKKQKKKNRTDIFGFKTERPNELFCCQKKTHSYAHEHGNISIRIRKIFVFDAAAIDSSFL